MRILMVTNAPWDRRLGGPRVQIELAEQFREQGHEVDSFSVDDAFPRPPRLRRVAALTRDFDRQATEFIRRSGGRYDVIDARAGALGASKARLRFDGLLVTRSTGLRPIYEREYLAAERSRPGAGGRTLTAPVRRLDRRRREGRHRQGFEHCDLLNVLNGDEVDYAREGLGRGADTVKLLHGLTRERFAAFAAARLPTPRRFDPPTVAFVGAWGRRKGSGDMAAIVAAIRARVPAARFRFLGTGASLAAVVADCGTDEGIEVVPSFESDELPGLLGDAAVGILPSYVEGFPFSVIELLAAGAPVVAYDAPGARETLPRLDPTLLVRRGDAAGFGNRVADLLADPVGLAGLAAEATAIADSLRWEEIAAETLEIYAERLARQ